MCKLDEILARRNEVNALARKNRAGRMFVFGSCARKEETPESDIDFLAEFEPTASLMNRAALVVELEDLFGCGIDVVPAKSLSSNPAFAANVRKDLVAV
ncbi:MAG: nucleotidyltransferase domain-containing protein [Kiritimatiellae bacterium]|nr:nucleotidyltransferase domain-containing protein [Kiritimatiellia bacterium]